MRSANSPAESAIRLAVFVRLGQTRSPAPDLAPVQPAKARYNPIRMISLRMPLQLSPVESHPCKIIGGYGVGCPYPAKCQNGIGSIAYGGLESRRNEVRPLQMVKGAVEVQ